MATATTGGTLAAGTFVYSVTAVVNGVETQASATGSQVTTGSTSTVTVTGAVVTGAQAYRFYGRTSGAGNQKFMVQQASNVFTDTGAITPSATVVPPAASSVSLQIPELQANRLIHGVPLATTVKQTGAYHSRDL
jgi:fibronectin type 3 domain-containing protein